MPAGKRAASSGASSMVTDKWPPSLKNYVNDCFKKCKNSIDKDQVEIFLRGKLVRAYDDGTIFTKDWSTESLPRSPAKKMCLEQISANASICDNSFLSDEGRKENEDQISHNLKPSRTGLVIIPIQTAATSTTNSRGTPRMPGELNEEVFQTICPSNNNTINSRFTPVFKCNPNTSVQNTQQSADVVQNLPDMSDVVTKMTNVISNEIITIKPQDSMPQRVQFAQTVQNNTRIKSNPMIQMSPRLKEYIEPVCITLSSDDEEEYTQASFSTLGKEDINQSQMLSYESESNDQSGLSTPVYQEEENNNDPQFPGVTLKHDEETQLYQKEESGKENKINEMEIEKESHEEVGEDGEILPEEEDVERDMMARSLLETFTGVLEYPLQCRSVRIGSFLVYPKTFCLYLYLAPEGLSFHVPMVTDKSKIIKITVKPCDIILMYVHFERNLPIFILFTTSSFGKSLRKDLNMTRSDLSYFDPTYNDVKQKYITFLIDQMTSQQQSFLRHCFLPGKKVLELDQKSANEILARSISNRVRNLQSMPITKPVTLMISDKFQTPGIQQYYLYIPFKDEDFYLIYILNELRGKTAIVFCRTCEIAETTAFLLRNLGFGSVPLHGKLKQPNKNEVLRLFHGGEMSILVATDIACKSLNISPVDVVINFNLPANRDDYFLRFRRVTKIGGDSKVINFVTEASTALYKSHLRLNLPLYPIDKDLVMVFLDEVMAARSLANKELKGIKLRDWYMS